MWATPYPSRPSRSAVRPRPTLSPNNWVGIGGIANTGITFATTASYVTPDGADVTTSQVYLRTF